LRENARIVVEGIDGSGKSTLVRKLLDGFGPEIAYLVLNDRGPDRDLGTFWYDSLGNNPAGRVAIHDRFFYPELVYGPVLRGRYSVEPGTIQYVSQYLRHFAFLIYCRPDDEAILIGVEAEQQMPGVKENLPSLLHQYDEIMAGELPLYRERFFLYDWRDDEADPRLLAALTGYLNG
jgi:hypothetical protein